MSGFFFRQPQELDDAVGGMLAIGVHHQRVAKAFREREPQAVEHRRALAAILRADDHAQVRLGLREAQGPFSLPSVLASITTQTGRQQASAARMVSRSCAPLL